MDSFQVTTLSEEGQVEPTFFHIKEAEMEANGGDSTYNFSPEYWQKESYTKKKKIVLISSGSCF